MPRAVSLHYKHTHTHVNDCRKAYDGSVSLLLFFLLLLLLFVAVVVVVFVAAAIVAVVLAYC